MYTRALQWTATHDIRNVFSKTPSVKTQKQRRLTVQDFPQGDRQTVDVRLRCSSQTNQRLRCQHSVHLLGIWHPLVAATRHGADTQHSTTTNRNDIGKASVVDLGSCK